MAHQAIKTVSIRKFDGADASEQPDVLAVEEPLEIRLEYGPAAERSTKSLSVTMRTPGTDEDLARGFLFTEGIVREASDIVGLRAQPFSNVLTVVLRPELHFEPSRLERHFYTTSSCGVCGKTSIEAVKTTTNCATVSERRHWEIRPDIVYSLPDTLRQAQRTFDATGGLHASALFDPEGNLLAIREDVGRHNALDKLIGHYLGQSIMPLDQHLLLLSGRASFELLQKAAMAGMRVVCAVGAPSSLAVETAESFGITLIGFLRDNRFNVYAGG